MMSGKLRAWLATAFILVVVLLVGCTVVLWRNLSTEWSVEGAAAQYALDHSPLNHLDNHNVFTGSGVEEVFSGKDMFGKRWYAFVGQSPRSIHYASASRVVSLSRVLRQCQKLSVTPTTTSLGYLDRTAQGALQTTSYLVWEVVGNSGRQSVYLYYDASTGQLIRRYNVK